MIHFEHFCNKHKGETGLVICNGPSLNKVPLAFLKKYPSFGTNRIYLMKDFLPTYYVCMTPTVINQFKKEIEQIPRDKFTLYGIPLNNSYKVKATKNKMFSYEPCVETYDGYTVTFMCLELAYYMGFQTVLVVGLDHRYQFLGRPDEVKTFVGDDVNHFSKEYFKDKKWNLPNLEEMKKSYQMAENAYRKDGRKIINLTEGSALDVFERGLISTWSLVLGIVAMSLTLLNSLD
jgi:hypothetical protein